MSEIIAVRWMRRYKLLFLLGLGILVIQIILAYKSLGISDLQTVQNSSEDNFIQRKRSSSSSFGNSNYPSSDEETSQAETKAQHEGSQQKHVASNASLLLPKQLGFEMECVINAKEAISALQRAKTKDCKKYIARVACAIQAGQFYPHQLPSYCPTNHTASTMLGCYRDEKQYRLLASYFINFKTTNTPERCMKLCLQSGYPYAGVQYATECFCGSDMPPISAKLPDSSCNMKCSGSKKEICGGYFSMNVYETGISKFTPNRAATVIHADTERIRIAFLLTLNGRALRQVYRLIRALYSPRHIFYIHVDARQDYLYRELLELESKFENIRLAPKRFATIWGGASLLTMLLQSMKDLLDSPIQWDFVINLSESDFPVKTVDKLVDFLTANKGRNFVKSHGRETQRFIQKQGLDKTFVECDTHMWRIGDRQLPAGIQVDGGSDWIALSREFVEYVTRRGGEKNELIDGLLKVFRHTLLPAESFFHTVLRNTEYCNTYIDNNLHVTNWKRKLGCKCQYKHVVDWCGCSPNDFKLEDWNRLQNTEQKHVFFARKFEPIVNQAIILKLEEWVTGPYPSEYINLHSYWQSLYNANDKYASSDDLTLTIANSLLRIASRKLENSTLRAQLIEITNYLNNDQYKGFLIRYRMPSLNGSLLELETRIRPVQYEKIAKNTKFAKRLHSFDVGSDYDQKEQIFRNFAKFLGPHSEPVLRFIFSGGVSSGHAIDSSSYTYNLTVLWIDPAGQLQNFNELHLEDSQSEAINFSKSNLKHPLIPGIWTVKLIGRSSIFAQTKFLISPLAYESGRPIRLARSHIINLGSAAVANNFSIPYEWQQHLPAADNVQMLEKLVEANARRDIDGELQSWIDELVGKFFHLRETCSVRNDLIASTETLLSLPLCTETAWSSLAPDPKSDIKILINRKRR